MELLEKEGLPRYLVRTVIAHLIRRGIFKVGETIYDMNITVMFSGKQTDHIKPNRYLHTSKEAWSRFLNSRPMEGEPTHTPPKAMETEKPPCAQPDQSKPGPKASSPINLETQAIALLIQHRDWSLGQIATSLGTHRTTIYKWPKFREAAQLAGRLKAREGKERQLPRGHKSCDGRVEAIAPDPSDK